MEIKFSEVDHIYQIIGKPKPSPSVTQIIREIIGCGWEADQWYLGRGRVIHACAVLVYQGKKFRFDERLIGYIKALEKFFVEVKPEPLGTTGPELLVGSEIYDFCGMIDLPCRINRVACILDYKHSMDKIRIALQLGGYSVALEESEKEKVTVGYGVQIKSDGTYQMSEKIDLRRPRNEFLALRTAYAIKERCGELSSQQSKRRI